MLLLLGFTLLGASFFPAMHFLPWASFHNEALAAAGTVLVCAEGLRCKSTRLWPPAAWCALALAVVPLLQWAGGLALYRADSILSAYYILLLTLCIVAGSQLASARRDDFLDGLATTLLLAALGSSVIAAAQWLDVMLPLPSIVFYEAMDGGRAIGNIAQPNQLACLVVLGVVGAAWLFQRHRVRGAWLAAAALLLGFALVASRSRAGLLMAGVLALWSWYAYRCGFSRLRPRAALAFVAYILLLSFAWAPLSVALDVGSVRADVGGMPVGTRPLHWQYMLAALRESPWLGYGWAEVIVGVSHIATSMPTPVFEMTEYSHTLPLDLMMWNGVPLGMMICAALLWWLVRHIQRLRDEGAGFALGVVLVIGAYSLVEFPYAYTFFLVPLGLMMGATDALSLDAPARVMWRSVHATLLALLAATGLLVAYEYVRLDTDIRDMRLSYFGLEQRKAPEDAPNVLVLDHLRAFLVLARTPVFDPQSDAQMAAHRRVVDRFPHPPLLVRYAVMAAKHGNPEQAREAMDRLCTLHTTNMCVTGHRDWRTWAEGDPVLEAVRFE